MARSAVTVAKAVEQPAQNALGGGMEGAERTTRETFAWNPAVISPDRQLNPVKDMADARARDSIQNDGYAMGAVHTHRDSIVGSQFRLNATPSLAIFKDEAWAEAFQEQAEAQFNLLGDSEDCWFDAARKNTFTGMIRLAVGGFLMGGEVLGTAEWFPGDPRRPFATAIQMISPHRLCNPDFRTDDETLRRGIERDRWGESKRYWFKKTHPGDFAMNGIDGWTWVPVDARKPWGRVQVIHIIEQLQVDQTRGVSDMVSVLKEMRMTKKFKEIVLQNAVVNATYAAAIESELPKEMVFSSMGAGQTGLGDMLGDYMTQLMNYVGSADNIAIDGVKMPHLFPGTKLNLKQMGTPGGVGTSFEESLLRHTASALGLSYEQFSRDYTKTNYSSARASMGETWKFMQARKKVVAERFARQIYMLWLEERLNAGALPLPPGYTAQQIWYGNPLLKEAISSSEWIGASRGQIDEKKETESAVLRMNNHLSTLENECARLGLDYRQVLRQRAREQKLILSLGLTVPSPDGKAAAQEDPPTDPPEDKRPN